MDQSILLPVLGFWALALGVKDQLERRLPNLWVAAGLVLALLWLTLYGQAPTGIGWSSALLGAGVGFALLFPGYQLGQVGAGDVKLLAVMGLFLGPLNVFLAMFVGYLTTMTVIGANSLFNRLKQQKLAYHLGSRSFEEVSEKTPLGLGLAIGFVIQLYDMLGLGASLKGLLL